MYTTMLLSLIAQNELKEGVLGIVDISVESYRFTVIMHPSTRSTDGKRGEKEGSK